MIEHGNGQPVRDPCVMNTGIPDRLPVFLFAKEASASHELTPKRWRSLSSPVFTDYLVEPEAVFTDPDAAFMAPVAVRAAGADDAVFGAGLHKN